ncbi:MAG: GH3 auxin-responsive promoter family protein [Pseudarcicella sp.]|nr:GH3 auxin-responsive promoter family protein [Pseudarcicella sp.]MBP6410857.1 GH3 auxin-responsive promoter family protein [Pseudarcicella sp.]
MKMKSFLAKPFAKMIVEKQRKDEQNPVEIQLKWMQSLVKTAQKTAFGEDFRLKEVIEYQSFSDAIPLLDYENLRPYIDRVVAGEENVLWKGKPKYFAKTSGTTSGVKFIPISAQSIGYHIQGARNALLHYVNETGKSDFLDKNLIFLSGSPIMKQQHGIYTGRLSGIVNHHIPAYLKSNQMPSFPINCIEDWESKLDAIVQETLPKPMSLISGIPPWVQMYFDKLQAKTGKKIKDIFPDFSLMVYGGVNFEPYRARLFDSIGKAIDTIETYPASEGFIAYQDSQNSEGLLLLINAGIFYEFVELNHFYDPSPQRVHLGDVKIGVNYAIILHTNAGLWGYILGDTVKFVSLNPPRIVVTGRVKHFISAFGEHVIGEEVEKAMKFAMAKHPEVELTEFTVAPQVNDPDKYLPYHEWLIEFSRKPNNIIQFQDDLNTHLSLLNVYYQDLMTGRVLQPLKMTLLCKGAFVEFMKSEGKLGGQNKVPRLSNDRKIADKLVFYKEM